MKNFPKIWAIYVEFFYKTKKFSKIFFRNSLKTQRFPGKNLPWYIDDSSMIEVSESQRIERPLRRFNLPIDICPKYFAQFYFAHLDICSNEICSKWRRHLPMKTLAQFHVSNYLCLALTFNYLLNGNTVGMVLKNSCKIFQSLASLMIFILTKLWFTKKPLNFSTQIHVGI